MSMQARQDLPLFNLVTDIDQHLSDYAREDDTDMIGLLLINSQTTHRRGCKWKRPRVDFCESEPCRLLRVLADRTDIGRKLWLSSRTCVRRWMTSPNRRQQQGRNNNGG